MSSPDLMHKLTRADGRTIAVICYLSIIGWVIALIMHGNNPSRLSAFHLRQMLGLILTWVLLSFIPFIGWILALPVALLWLIGLFDAIKGRLYPIPILGEFYQQSFNTLIE
ncbi:DUF4870 domain-containing protein [Thalassotalea aquiviva]|uniref:DUF4870 domain-containing protein n=1 Tax=Thalassotalea aquiviva TaxID=3242415 RepID=UPI00352B8551